jgi:hypothetical protein
MAAGIGSCDCHTKTPDAAFHAEHCRYLKILSALDSLEIVEEGIAALAQCAPEPAAWQWRYVGEDEWKTPSGGIKLTAEELKRERPIEQRPLFAAPAQAPLMHRPEHIIEAIILLRLHEKRIEGYTIETAQEIAEALSLSIPAKAERKALEQIAIVCTKNMDRDCNHRMALDYVREIANDTISALPSTARAVLPGHDETMANLDALTIKSTDPRCTCAAIVNPNIPHARTCPLFSPQSGGQS